MWRSHARVPAIQRPSENRKSSRKPALPPLRPRGGGPGGRRCAEPLCPLRRKCRTSSQSPTLTFPRRRWRG
ncbi:hypothetical protein [Kingella potus]|uniref:hypothetical protein n=1 Tax=Kingella potus TaxID=265175 RepID=UPI001FD3BD81|nr:hypothetical protein [Kingella potus]UOP01171.1 hypothetical protein LVJ84_02325 [Kingella potus]